jgi:hypothetical protein
MTRPRAAFTRNTGGLDASGMIFPNAENGVGVNGAPASPEKGKSLFGSPTIFG